MIRAATTGDNQRIVEMGVRFLREGPYRDSLGENPAQAARFAQAVIESPNGKVLVAEDDGKLVGVIAFVLSDHYFSAERIATELIWYVEPKYRHSWYGVCLFRHAEHMARELGAKWMQFTAPIMNPHETPELGRLYLALGYKPIEVGYQKAL